ncbi:MAG: type II toxin-antitoxin system RelE/ParE family toxin [Prochloraceae cyanobacterium]|nr:type II toxin-antitoxin system RelE/ParE family toxin [Prochloraceae cyanobacterium]
MKTEYLPSFIKDLKKLKKTPAYAQIRAIAFETIPQYQSITKINNLKKIKGATNAYRIRVGDYRLGVFIQNDTITFSRVLHRKEVYRYFP